MGVKTTKVVQKKDGDTLKIETSDVALESNVLAEIGLQVLNKAQEEVKFVKSIDDEYVKDMENDLKELEDTKDKLQVLREKTKEFIQVTEDRFAARGLMIVNLRKLYQEKREELKCLLS